MKQVILIFLLLIFSSTFASAALGISPAKKEFAYAPGEKIVIDYDILSDNPSQKLTAYASGTFSEYVTFSDTTFKGPDNFRITLTLPDTVDKPGLHVLNIGVREEAPEDQFIGTSINIAAVVKIFVPYPGRYAEVTLDIPDANVNEDIPVEAYVINRGDEDLTVHVSINFFDEGDQLVHTMPFQPVFLESGDGDRYFRKFLNTTGFKPGEYTAEAIVQYGEETRLNETFRIGSVFVNITNFTETLEQDGIQKYFIGVQNKWNGIMKAVYADVNISNESYHTTFRTPPIDLDPWQHSMLTGFFDTEGLEGTYDVAITLNFGNEQLSSVGTLVITAPNIIIYVGIGSAVVVVLLILLLLIITLRKKKKSTK